MTARRSQSRFVYPRATLTVAYLRAGLGLGLTAGPAVSLDLPAISFALLVSLALLFALSVLQTLRQQRLELIRDGRGVTILPVGAYLEFAALSSVRLDYFSTRRDRENGWMQLRLAAPGVRFKVDSRLAGFEILVQDALAGATRKGLEMSPATMDNFEAVKTGAFRRL